MESTPLTSAQAQSQSNQPKTSSPPSYQTMPSSSAASSYHAASGGPSSTAPSSQRPSTNSRLDTSALVEQSKKQARKDFLIGIGLLMLVVILWTLSNFLTNTVLTSGYDKPFAMTYFTTSSFVMYLVPFAVSWASRRSQKRRSRSDRPSTEVSASDIDADLDGKAEQDDFWQRLGFKLPDESAERGRYAVLPVADADVEAGAGVDEHVTNTLSDGSLAVRMRHRVSSLEPSVRPTSRPSSIDGRRPRSIIAAPIERTSIAPSNGGAGKDVLAVPLALPPLTLRETAVLAAQFTIIWFIANWSINAALGLTSVASGTTLSASSGLFTLVLASLMGVEKFSWAKLGAVVMSFAGVALVTQADTSPASSALVTAAAVGSTVGASTGTTGSAAALFARDVAERLGPQPVNAFLGDFLSLTSALFYAIYVTLLKVRIGSEDRVSMPLFFGFVGAYNVIGMWPVGVMLHLTGVEPFAWPEDRLTWAGLGCNMVITFVSDFAYLLAMLKSSPLVATVGLSLTIPLAVLGDTLRGSHTGGLQADFGSVLVLASFVIIGLADESALEQEQEDIVDAAAASLLASNGTEVEDFDEAEAVQSQTRGRRSRVD